MSCLGNSVCCSRRSSNSPTH